MATCAEEETTVGRKAPAVRGVRGPKVDQGTEVHYCTRPEAHTGDHLCPCGYRWPVA